MADAPPPAGVSIAEAISQGRRELARAGCEQARLDGELLLAAALGVGRERLILDHGRTLDPPEHGRYLQAIERRAAREPVAYILGRRDFRRITLAVDRRVLIPRPETELLVEVGLGLPAGARVADVGTGSGAVALALADERPDLLVRGLDVSEDALAVARANARRLGLAAEFAAADLLDGERYDAVLANLPYIPDGAPLEPEISLYEPSRALFAGPDGLDLVRRLIRRVGIGTGVGVGVGVKAGGGVGAAAGPRPLPLLALEIGSEQCAEVVGLMRVAGFGTVEVLKDLAGLDRVVVGSA